MVTLDYKELLASDVISDKQRAGTLAQLALFTRSAFGWSQLERNIVDIPEPIAIKIEGKFPTIKDLVLIENAIETVGFIDKNDKARDESNLEFIAAVAAGMLIEVTIQEERLIFSFTITKKDSSGHTSSTFWIATFRIRKSE